MRLWVFGVAVLAAALVVPGALGTTRGAARPNTTVPDVFLPVHVTMTDSRISLDRKSGHRGDEVRFTIRNAGTKTHNFTLGTDDEAGHRRSGRLLDDAQAEAREGVPALPRLPRRRCRTSSIVKADLKKPGMRGIFKIL